MSFHSNEIVPGYLTLACSTISSSGLESTTRTALVHIMGGRPAMLPVVKHSYNKQSYEHDVRCCSSITLSCTLQCFPHNLLLLVLLADRVLKVLFLFKILDIQLITFEQRWDVGT